MKHTKGNSAGPRGRCVRRCRLNRRLLGYTATAGAALAVAGTAGSADGAIVADNNFPGPITVNSLNPSVSFDLIGGGIHGSGFGIRLWSTNSSHFKSNELAFVQWYPIGAGAFNRVMTQNGIVSKLAKGATIGPNGAIINANDLVGLAAAGTYNASPFASGNFLGANPGYIGVKFSLNYGHQTDYGWISHRNPRRCLRCHDYRLGLRRFRCADRRGRHRPAIPEPTSLAVWALGALSAAGVAMLRRWKKED